MKSFLLAALALVSASAFALPEAPFDALAPERLAQRNTKMMRAYDFEGIVKLSNCSGSLVAFHGMSFNSKAIVMTNGHCIQKPGGFLSPGEVWVNRAIKRAMKLYDKSFKLHDIMTEGIVYATMTNTDVAYYQLTETYAQINQRTGVRPFFLDALRPSIGMPIDIISGYWDRGYSCDIDNFVFQIKEDAWTWVDSIRYTAGCDTIGGTSGSPIILRGEKRVIGINNTSNESGARCTMNNPCEVSQNGQVHHQKGVRYGQQTYNVYTCLTPDFRIDVNRPGCDLPK